jgi:hypothetical protein
MESARYSSQILMKPELSGQIFDESSNRQGLHFFSVIYFECTTRAIYK